jgi:hypothetical protein
MTERQIGLYEKYAVQRIVSLDSEGDIAEVEPVKEFCFVLKPDSDPIALDALKLYAAMAHLQGYERLADDLMRVVWDMEEPTQDEGEVHVMDGDKLVRGRIDTRPRIYETCGQCRLRIWQHVGEEYWHHEDVIQATIVGGGGHRPWPEEVKLPGPNEPDGRPPVAPVDPPPAPHQPYA